MSDVPAGEFLLPLFPLPDMVFFPNTRLPLHVFEPRYRKLIADVISGDSRFGVILLRSGWERDYQGAPPIHPCGTLGTVEQLVALDDGRYNLILRGDVRFRVVGEIEHAPYRVARAVVVPEIARSAEAAYAERQWLADLARDYMRYLPNQVPVPEIATVGLSPLTNALTMSLNLDAERKQHLLELDDLVDRATEIGREHAERIETIRFLEPYRREGDPGAN
jgi:Lon protease-like protein